MKETNGLDIFDQIEKADAICITTNCSLIEDRNPMGGGVAGAARKLWPYIEEYYGIQLKRVGFSTCVIGYINVMDSSILEVPTYAWDTLDTCYTALVAFPTMFSVTEPASYGLVKQSAERLLSLAHFNDWQNVYLAAPGIGVGGLDYSKVKGILENILDDRFTVMRK